MSKDKIADYDSTTAGNNTDIGGISIAEGMLPSAVNNSMRELTKQLGAFADGTDGIDVLNLHDDDASASIKIQAPSAVTTTTTFTLPDGDGSADQVLKTDGSGQLGFADRHANPSLIVNGGMTVAQRGDVTGITNPGVFGGADRFCTNGSSFGTVSLVQEADAPEEFAYSQRVKFTTARSTTNTSDHFVLGTRLEGQDLQHLNKGTSNAKSVTVSFYAKASQSTTIQLELYDADNSRHAGKEFAITTSWAKYSYTFAGDTTGAFDNDNNLSLHVFFWLGAGTDFTSGTNPDGSWIANTNTRRVHSDVGTTFMDTLNAEFNLTGVKLEVGSTATDFIHEDYGTTLARCQRFFYREVDDDGAMFSWVGFADSSTAAYLQHPHPVEMRAEPSMSTTETAGDYSLRIGANTVGCSHVPLLSSSTKRVGHVQWRVSSGLTTGQAMVGKHDAAGKYIDWSAEL